MIEETREEYVERIEREGFIEALREGNASNVDIAFAYVATLDRGSLERVAADAVLDNNVFLADAKAWAKGIA